MTVFYTKLSFFLIEFLKTIQPPEPGRQGKKVHFEPQISPKLNIRVLKSCEILVYLGIAIINLLIIKCLKIRYFIILLKLWLPQTISHQFINLFNFRNNLHYIVPSTIVVLQRKLFLDQVWKILVAIQVKIEVSIYLSHKRI